MKTSLDPDGGIESIENDKDMPVHLKFLRKILICAFAVLKFFGKIRRKCEKTHIESSLVARFCFCASTTAGIIEKQDPFKKIDLGLFEREIRGSRVGKIEI